MTTHAERNRKEGELATIVGATIIDGNGRAPIKDGVIVIEGKRIIGIGGKNTPIPPTAKKIDAYGKYAIPGLMNANVHLLSVGVGVENIIRYIGRYEELIAESAQVALKSGLTTVFDTYGPRRFLMAVRDKISSGEVQGSRLFCGGNIIGFDGPFSDDFFADAPGIVSAALTRRINAIWAENVGRSLMWLAPQEVAREVRTYIRKGSDFLKYSSNSHFPGAFLVFSKEAQIAIVAEAHEAGITAQAHSMAIEGLRIAVEAGCDLVTHCNITGPTPRVNGEARDWGSHFSVDAEGVGLDQGERV